MSSNGAGPWKIASDEASTSKLTDTRSFPPLSAKAQTKKQSRLRALYTQTPHINPYTPRRDQINRQELERLQSDYIDEDGQIVGTSIEAEEPPQEGIQSSGVSSISIRDNRGHRIRRDPDRFKRPSAYRKSVSRLQANNVDRSTHITGDRSSEPPTPFTDAKINGLLSECQRRQRATAAQQRLYAEGRFDNDPYQPLTSELEKAFASLDGFLSAFGKAGMGEEANGIEEAIC